MGETEEGEEIAEAYKGESRVRVRRKMGAMNTNTTITANDFLRGASDWEEKGIMGIGRRK